MIKNLANSDWVKKGLDYLPEEIDDSGTPCPFCQEKTITKNVVSNIKDYFDETYENDIDELKKLLSDYEKAINSIQSKKTYEAHSFIIENKTDFGNLYDLVLKVLDINKRKFEEKLKTPSQRVTLDNSSKAVENLNQFINNINEKIDEHNRKIDNIEGSLNQVKETFWNIMRWDYDQTLSSCQKDSKTVQNKKWGQVYC